MNLRELVNKAKQESLEEVDIEAYLLEYVKNEAIVDAMIELEKRDKQNIYIYLEGGELIINCYYKNLRSLKISFIWGKDYIGELRYNIPQNTFEVHPHKQDCFGNGDDRLGRTNLIKMKNLIKNQGKNFIVKTIYTELERLID